MKTKSKFSIAEHFETVEDPRIERSKEHLLIDILTIAILSVICGANGWVGMETYGKAKDKWLKTFLALPNGIPSHDTFARVFARLNPEQLQESFLSWITAVKKVSEGEVIAIDGKTVRRSYDKGKNKGAIHMVSAWASQNRLVLGQRKVDDKSNEITAIPELLKVLDINGCIVTIDAMGTQKEIAKQIIAQRGDYILALKGNQGNLCEDVKQIFSQAQAKNFQGLEHDFYQTIDSGHGRIEKRRCWTLGQVEYLIDAEQWSHFTSIAMVESVRKSEGHTSRELRYYISSLPPNAKLLAESIRSHWTIEKRCDPASATDARERAPRDPLHWVLDVAFREDDCRIRTGYAPENFTILRHLALSALNQEKTAKLGIQNKRRRAGWDNDYLLKVLAG